MNNNKRIVKKAASIDKNSTRYRENLMKKAVIAKIVAFIVVLMAGAVISLIMPLRPKVSYTEGRTLAEFPKISTESFMSGDYFSAIDSWFSDTFPFRDNLISLNDKVESLYGIRDSVIYGEIVAGDTIPDVDVDVDELLKPVDKVDSDDTSSNDDLSYEEPDDNDIQTGETFGSIFVYDDSAYEYFVYSQQNTDEYVNIVNNLANAVQGEASFYSVIAPTSMDIILDDKVRSSVSSSDQRKAILYMYSCMSDKVNKTFTYDMLRSHRDEYIYFRSDHHWTSLGAYYTYCMLAQQMGFTPNSQDSYEKKEFTDFHGSFYTSTKEESLIINPDRVTAYVPRSTNSLVYQDADGRKNNYKIVADVSSFQPRNKYSTFIGGDNPYTEIVNPDLSDGSSCLVVKDSFGNALVPFLVDHFQYVYVVDYRHYKGTVSQLVKSKKIANVVMLNYVVATSSSATIKDMKKVCR